MNSHRLWYDCSNQEDRTHLYDEYEKSLRRALLSEGHELIVAYCKETDQLTLYEAEPWYQFAKTMRNTVSHKNGGVLHRWPGELKNKGITTVAWRNRCIDISMLNKVVDFAPKEALQLFNDQMKFAQDKLT